MDLRSLVPRASRPASLLCFALIDLTAAALCAQDPVLTPGNQIVVIVKNATDLSAPHLIRPDGRITLGTAGDVAAEGLTTEALGAVIAEKLRPQTTNPQVKVSLLDANPRYFVTGQVKRAGGGAPRPVKSEQNIYLKSGDIIVVH